MKKDKTILQKLFFSSFFTLMLVELSNAVSCVVDGVVTSRLLGGTAMAAYGIASPYFSIAAIISGILMVSGQTLCSKALGKGDRAEANRIFSTICLTGVILSSAASVLGYIFSDQIAMLFGARGNYAVLRSSTSLYLKGLFLGTPFTVMLAILAPIVQLDGDGKLANISSAVVSVIDIVIDIVGVVVFKGGLLVIAISTSLSRFVAFFVLLTHFFKRDAGFKFSFGDFDFKGALSAMSTGLPQGVSMLCRAIGPIITNTIVLSVAATAGMTALSVQSNLEFILGAAGCGISGAVLVLSGLYYGEQDKHALKNVFSLSVRYSLIATGSIASAVILFSSLIAKLYVPANVYIAAMASSAIRWFALSLPFLSVNLCIANYLQATGRKAGAYLMNIGSELVCEITCIIALSNLFGLKGVWEAFLGGQVLLLALYFITVFCDRGKYLCFFDKFLRLRAGFGIADSKRLSRSVKTLEDTVELSNATRELCQKHGIDRRRSFLAALFIEEMTGNVLEHGFTKDTKPHSLEARVTVDGNDVILRIRDDCRRFDLKEKAANWQLDPEHPEKNMGIRIVLGMATDVKYTSALGTNNVLIRL